jgi:hypothetical protein
MLYRNTTTDTYNIIHNAIANTNLFPSLQKTVVAATRMHWGADLVDNIGETVIMGMNVLPAIELSG